MPVTYMRTTVIWNIILTFETNPPKKYFQQFQSLVLIMRLTYKHF